MFSPDCFEQSDRWTDIHFNSDPSIPVVFGTGQQTYSWERMSEQRWDPSTYPDILPSVTSNASVHASRRNQGAPPVPEDPRVINSVHSLHGNYSVPHPNQVFDMAMRFYVDMSEDDSVLIREICLYIIYEGFAAVDKISYRCLLALI